MKRPLLFTACLLAVLAAVQAQCPDFTDLDAPGVTLSQGPWDIPSHDPGYDPTLFEVITQPGMDPYTGYQLPIIPSGETAVVKIGNDLGGMKSRAIHYTFTVDADYPILHIKYAVVMKHAGSFHNQGPFFRIILVDDGFVPAVASGGVSIYACGNYSYDSYAHDGIISGMYSWFPWRSIGIDLSDHIGQQITVYFVSYDCKHHSNEFCYAYFTASCKENHLTLVDCDGQNITLAAPDGYPGYEWNNGAITQTSTYPLQDNLDIQCHVVSSGCVPDLDINSIEGLTLANGETWYDTICEGESYFGHGFDLLAQDEPGSFTFSRTVLDPNDCLSGTIHKLHLTVLQRDVHYYETACEGTDYDQYGFHYSNLQVGNHIDSLPLATDNGCTPAYQYLHLTVIPSLTQSGALTGETDLCDYTPSHYIIFYPGPISQYQWNIPDGVTNFTDPPTQDATLYFTEDAPNPAIISVTGTDACGTHTQSITVWHHPSYYLFYEDTICTGETYDNHGIHTALIDSAGLYYLTLHNTTVNGCDSNVMVRLLVGNTPGLATLAQPEEVCTGQSAIIHALGDNASFNVAPDPLAVVPGDILCTDLTIVKPDDWPVQGKTAKAIVFYVDTTGQHGWAVHLNNISTHDFICPPCNYTGVILHNNPRDAVLDLDGLTNTQQIKDILASHGSDAVFFNFHFNSGWYLPAAGQLRILCARQNTINSSLQVVGGTPLFESSTDWTINVHSYWSSSMRDVGDISSNNNTEWYVSSSGKLNYMAIWSLLPTGHPGEPGTRSICNF